MFCNHHTSAKCCRVHENKGLWVEIIMSKLLPDIAYLVEGRCFIDLGQ
jgi:hypothetical protein